MRQMFLSRLKHLLIEEEALVESLKNSQVAARLSAGRKRLLAHLRKLAQSDDLPLMIETEREIIEGDLLRYANSAAMVSSLKKALEGMDVIAHHIGLVANREKYAIIDQGHSMAQNRKTGLPFDEARQALASHTARLTNMDKSRLDEDDKQLIDGRKALMIRATECYAKQQALILAAESVSAGHQD